MRHSNLSSPHAASKVAGHASRTGVPVVVLTRGDQIGTKRSIPVGVHTVQRNCNSPTLMEVILLAAKNQQALQSNIYKA